MLDAASFAQLVNTVEPFTNYFSGRVAKDLRGGATHVKAMATSVYRDLSDPYVALRLSRQVPEHWVGRTLGTAQYKVYVKRGASGLPQRKQPLAALLAKAPWIAFEREGTANRFGRWMQQHIPSEQVRLRVDMFNSMVMMLCTGLAIGVLPTFVAASEPDLMPISAAIDDLATPLWILTHPDLRRTARVQAFMKLVGDAVAKTLQNSS